MSLRRLLTDILERLTNLEVLMATLDADVQAATTVINDLVAALGAEGSGVSTADQTALETAIAAGQAALAPAAPPAGAADGTATPGATTNEAGTPLPPQ